MEELIAERDAVRDQLTACEEQASWCVATDDLTELAEAKMWEKQAAALQRTLDDLEVKIFAEELSGL